MAFLKKWTNCIMSFVAGVLGLSLSACSGMVSSTALGEEKTKAIKVITDSNLSTQAKQLGIDSEFGLLRTFSIIMMIVSIIIIAYSVILLLVNTNVIKSTSKAFDIINIVLAVLLIAIAITLMIASNNYCSALHSATAKLVTAKLGLYQPFMLTVSIINIVLSSTFTFIKNK